MSWIRSGLSSIAPSGWFMPAPAVVPDVVELVVKARAAMLAALGDAGVRAQSGLAVRIVAACDLRALWALRCELMNACGQLYGEAEGSRRLAQVTACFEGVLPDAAPRRRRPALAAALAG